MAERPLILLSNDDGYRSRGISTLRAALLGVADVIVCAPETEQSAASHALSLHRPLRLFRHDDGVYSVDGTPADCVYLAVNHLMKDARPTLVLSGINHGPNLADDVVYSGTVAAAMEGSLLGVPAIAFSLATRRTFEFEHATQFARALVKAALGSALPRRMLLNVNIPAYPPLKGYQVTRLGRHTYGADVVEKEDPRGRKYYWIGGTGYEHVTEPGTDVTAVHDEQLVSISPIMLDLTDASMLEPVAAWPLEGYQQHRHKS